MTQTTSAQGLPRVLNGIGDIAAFYDAFILDLWGVVHDGVAPFADTVPTLREIRRAKRRVYLLSNAPRRSAVVAARLTEMGITPDLYDGIVTSGEATWMALQERYLQEWGRKCFHLGADRDHSIYEGLDIDLVPLLADAAFVVATGVADFGDTIEKYRPVLEEAASRGLPLICANPDRIVHVEDKLVVCAGTFADIYESLDGQVVYFGKPHRMVYRLCLSALEGARTLAIGDAMPTDIAGATAAGLDSALVTSGIHRDVFAVPAENEAAAENRLEAFLKPFPFRPTYLVDRLFW